MQDIVNTIIDYLSQTGFGQFHWTNAVMIGVGLLFIFLAVKKGFEPLLLVPIGFGILIGNIPYDASKVSLSVYDGPIAAEHLTYRSFVVTAVHLDDGLFEPPAEEAWSFPAAEDIALHGAIGEGRVRAITGEPDPTVETEWALRLAHENGRAIVLNTHDKLSPRGDVDGPGIYPAGNGRFVFVDERSAEGRYPQLWTLDRQDPHNASVFWWLFAGVGVGGFYPPLIFLGIGALTDFGPLLSRPKTLILGAAAQFGIFGSLLAALVFGFDIREAASIGIIGGADGPTAIFTCSQLAPELLGAVALAAYSYMALVPIIQPPIIRLLTTPEERRIRMREPRPVPKGLRIAFPVAGFLLTAAFAPGGLPLLGMLFFGNLLRESLVTDRLAQTAQGAFIDIVTILLGVTVGAKTAASSFLTLDTIKVFGIGIAAFALATAAGVLFAKLMSRLDKDDPINPMIGAAGVSAVPMAARVVHKMGLEEDNQNFLLMHAMGPNVAGVIGSAVAAGVLLSALAKGG